jgi:DNA-directed RNA polymerase specialized sigma24 family protein
VADLRRAPGLSAEDVSAAVRIHADRLHDFVRRLGCSPSTAVEVVETSALDLVDAVATAPESVPDAVGWWFGRARALGRRVPDSSTELPLGGGVLSADEDQAVLAETLETLPERERVALLLRDSYALPATAVAVALGIDPEAALETVGRARLAFLAAVETPDVVPPAGHAMDLGALARLAEGGPVAAADATTRRHAQACPICRSVWDGQARAHQMLAGLTVVALPEAYREGVLDRVDAQARAYLPSAAELLTAADGDYVDDRPSRWLVPLYVLGGLAAAVVVGVVIGLLLSRGSGGGTTTAAPPDPGVLPQVTAAPLKTGSPLPTTFPTLSGQPSPTVFIVTPSPSPQPSGGPQKSPTGPPEPATEPLTLTANPTSGPNGATVSLQGTGWTPGSTVTIDYLDPLGRQTGSHANAAIDARGRFTTTLSAQDPSNLPGRHTIRATDGTQTTSATYDVSG